MDEGPACRLRKPVWRADGKIHRILVTIAMLAGTTGAGATAFADETVTDGGNVAAESAASQPESTQQSDAENAVGSDVADIAG